MVGATHFGTVALWIWPFVRSFPPCPAVEVPGAAAVIVSAWKVLCGGAPDLAPSVAVVFPAGCSASPRPSWTGCDPRSIVPSPSGVAAPSAIV